MNDKNRIILLSILAFLVLVIWAVAVAGDKWETKRDTEKEISKVIVGKYRKPSFLSRHNEPTLIVVDSTEITTELNTFRWCTDVFWEYVEIGDRITKPSGVLILTVSKPSGEHKSFRYYTASAAGKYRKVGDANSPLMSK